jgi:single-strand DNA-binding protein
MPDNTVTVIGNITREPELRFTPSGQAIASFGLAVNRRWQNKSTQEWEEAVSFFDVVAWAKLGENAAESLSKGSRVMVTGRLEQRSWETDQGDKRSKVEIVADDIGASMKWATVEVTRNERSETSASNRPSQQQRPATTDIPGQTTSGYDPAEEPF